MRHSCKTSATRRVDRDSICGLLAFGRRLSRTAREGCCPCPGGGAHLACGRHRSRRTCRCHARDNGANRAAQFKALVTKYRGSSSASQPHPSAKQNVAQQSDRSPHTAPCQVSLATSQGAFRYIGCTASLRATTSRRSGRSARERISHPRRTEARTTDPFRRTTPPPARTDNLERAHSASQKVSIYRVESVHSRCLASGSNG